MGLSVCPAAVVAAPVEVVWANLVDWERLAAWADVRVERCEPAGPATVGQTITFAGRAVGRTWRFRIFPPGWWGWVLQTFGARVLGASVDDSLRRLKRAAERAHRPAP
jgi:hypothetical protein